MSIRTKKRRITICANYIVYLLLHENRSGSIQELRKMIQYNFWMNVNVYLCLSYVQRLTIKHRGGMFIRCKILYKVAIVPSYFYIFLLYSTDTTQFVTKYKWRYDWNNKRSEVMFHQHNLQQYVQQYIHYLFSKQFIYNRSVNKYASYCFQLFERCWRLKDVSFNIFKMHWTTSHRKIHMYSDIVM